jgi:hypothetical protein
VHFKAMNPIAKLSLKHKRIIVFRNKYCHSPSKDVITAYFGTLKRYLAALPGRAVGGGRSGNARNTNSN